MNWNESKLLVHLEYDDSEIDISSTLHSPSILNDPYSYASNKDTLKTNQIEGRHGIEE